MIQRYTEVTREFIDEELIIQTSQVAGSTVVWYKHKKEEHKLCFYLVGGGMVKYPKPKQVKGLIRLIKQCNIDFVLPYYPLVLNGHTLPDTYEMLYELYKKALEEYKPEKYINDVSRIFLVVLIKYLT